MSERSVSKKYFKGQSAAGKDYRVTIITAVLNGAKTLKRNIESVRSQTYDNKEHIIVDGGSTDGTLNIISQYAGILKWHSGPDEGIGDAMNKGLELANGDFVVFLHADDRLADSNSLANAMKSVENTAVLWAFDILYDRLGRVERKKPRPFDWRVRFKTPFPHQGLLTPRWLFEEFGGYDTRLRVPMDYEFLLRIYLAGVKAKRPGRVLSVMGSEGISSRRDWASLRARFLEERKVHSRHAGSALWRAVYALYWPAYLGYRWTRNRLLREGRADEKRRS